MGTFTNSWALIGQCFAVLKKDKELLLFPVFSAIAAVLLFVGFLFPLLFSPLYGKDAGLIVLVLLYFLISFAVIFFNTALIACAKHRLEGNNPTLGYGFTFAFSRMGSILGWALISATVGIILRVLSGKSGNNTLGRIVISLLGLAWSLLTFFVIPVFAFEKVGVIEAIKRSGGLFRKTWGENVVGQFSIGAGFMALFLLLIIGAVFSLFARIPQLLAVFALAFVLLLILSSALQAIFVAALYMYSTTGRVPNVFEEKLVKSAFVQR